MISSAPALIPSCRQSAASNSRQFTMTITSYSRIVTTTAVLFLFALLFAVRASADPQPGVQFRCDDGSNLVLSFSDKGTAFSAIVRVHGTSYWLPAQAPEPGPVQIVWSNGSSSLTWSPGVRLMWMSSETHLMCGRGGHQH
jgi:hypothetical protein